jgi:hypothetical protein
MRTLPDMQVTSRGDEILISMGGMDYILSPSQATVLARQLGSALLDCHISKRSNEIRHKKCKGDKRCYTSTNQAKKAHRTAGYRIRTYTCDDCNTIHVANAEKL